MSQNQTEKIKVVFNGKTWEFEYSPEFTEEHFKRVLAPEVPEIINATSQTKYEDNGKTKVIEFKKQLKYKG